MLSVLSQAQNIWMSTCGTFLQCKLEEQGSMISETPDLGRPNLICLVWFERPDSVQLRTFSPVIMHHLKFCDRFGNLKGHLSQSEISLRTTLSRFQSSKLSSSSHLYRIYCSKPSSTPGFFVLG